ncbi:hypothetical protein [Shewanella surugensis]|uniref:Uncharacterized protein n=1 Tax=Shewanella surugensis TaxID=212020 RepID=A0ABT0LIJ9_9GAMM|nr:hypothetical protein [Shewanella surugensis]MCL1127490.1 hypothetical protein [Shewanella surugensis]
MKGNFCTVKTFKPSQRTLDAIKEMNRITDMSNLLTGILTLVPFFQIFVGRKTYLLAGAASSRYNMATSDWQHFSDVLQGVGKNKRDLLEGVAYQTANSTTGEEAKFWRCVYGAL